MGKHLVVGLILFMTFFSVLRELHAVNSRYKTLCYFLESNTKFGKIVPLVSVLESNRNVY